MQKTKDKKAVLLINLGAPGSLDDIEPFLRNLFFDPMILPIAPAFLRKFVAGIIARRRTPVVKPRYSLIGGGSPLLQITAKQASALENWLRTKGLEVPVFIGMRYSTPTIEDALREISSAGANFLVILCLYPQFSFTTTSSALKEVNRVLKKMNYNPQIACINRWCEHPLYIEALAQRLKKALGEFEPDVQDEVRIIFSAHSIPERSVRKGDPYPNDVALTVRGVLGHLQISNKWHIAYQSRAGRLRWLSPAVDELILNLIGEGARSFLLMPVSFVSDHFETLYEIDILLNNRLKSAGVEHFRRTDSLNDAPDFIEVLGQLVTEALQTS